MLLFSSISFHLALASPTSPDPEDKIMVISIRERIWRHAGTPSTLFLKVSSLEVTCAHEVLTRLSGHDMASQCSRVDGHHRLAMGYAAVAPHHFGPPERATRACRSKQIHRAVRPRRITRRNRWNSPLPIISNPRPVLHVRAMHSQGAQAHYTRSLRYRSASGLCRSVNVHFRVVDCTRQSWVVVTRVGHFGRHMDQGRARQLESSRGGICCDSGSSVDGGGLVSIQEVWQGMGELGKKGEIQARAIRLLGIFAINIIYPRGSLRLSNRSYSNNLKYIRTYVLFVRYFLHANAFASKYPSYFQTQKQTTYTLTINDHRKEREELVKRASNLLPGLNACAERIDTCPSIVQ